LLEVAGGASSNVKTPLLSDKLNNLLPDASFNKLVFRSLIGSTTGSLFSKALEP